MKCTVSRYEGIRKEAEQHGIILTNQEFQNVIKLCNRKIKMNRLGADYMELLLPDEIKHYAFRREVNKTTFMLFRETEEMKNGTDYRKTVPC